MKHQVREEIFNSMLDIQRKICDAGYHSLCGLIICFAGIIRDKQEESFMSDIETYLRRMQLIIDDDELCKEYYDMGKKHRVRILAAADLAFLVSRAKVENLPDVSSMLQATQIAIATVTENMLEKTYKEYYKNVRSFMDGHTLPDGIREMLKGIIKIRSKDGLNDEDMVKKLREVVSGSMLSSLTPPTPELIGKLQKLFGRIVRTFNRMEEIKDLPRNQEHDDLIAEVHNIWDEMHDLGIVIVNPFNKGGKSEEGETADSDL